MRFHHSDPDMHKAHQLVMDDPTSVALQSGSWSNPHTWDVPPADGGRVRIPEGIAVVQDVDTPDLRWLHIEGDFSPSDGADVELAAEDVIADMHSRVWAGTASCPFAGRWTWTFLSAGPITDPWMMGRVFMPMGIVDFHAEPKTAWLPIEGVAKGATTIRLKFLPVGWRVGDRLMLPGVGFNALDDDVVFISAINGQDVTLTTPLQFDHGDRDRFGGERPMFVVNLARRAIHFESEAYDVKRRGHIMIMREDTSVLQAFRHCSFRRIGRTDKSRPVTDPDGHGNGRENARGRYIIHFHLTGADRDGVPGIVDGCVFEDSPGWGPTNHGGFVNMTDCASYLIDGSHFVGENGAELGRFARCVASRSRLPLSGAGAVENHGGNDDWGKRGHGFFTMTGGIKVDDCIATGMPSFAAAFIGQQFVTPKPIWFDASNLDPEFVSDQPLIKAQFVPQRHRGIHWFGCNRGIFCWAFNNFGTDQKLIGRARLEDCGGEDWEIGLNIKYAGDIDVVRWRGVRIGSDYQGTGMICNNGTTRTDLIDCELLGYNLGVDTPVMGDCSIVNFRHRCLTGLLIAMANPDGERFLRIINPATIPIPAAELEAERKKKRMVRWHFDNRQDQQQALIVMQVAFGANHPWTQDNPRVFAHYCATPDIWLPRDRVTLEEGDTVRRLYFPECHRDFALGRMMATPAPLRALTTGQAIDRYGIVMFSQLIPDDAEPLEGSVAFVSPNDSTYLPRFNVGRPDNKRLENYCMTNVTQGFVLRAKDSQGRFVFGEPTDLEDKAWNIATAEADGRTRGALVFCDSESTPDEPRW